MDPVGAIYADIRLSNFEDQMAARRGSSTPIRTVVVRALVDTGATSLMIPRDVSDSLGLEPLGVRLATLANGEVVECELVGAVEVAFANRTSVGTAIALPPGSQVLLGALQMEDMDLIPDPKGQRLMVNPESPDFARVLAVGAQVHYAPANSSLEPNVP